MTSRTDALESLLAAIREDRASGAAELADRGVAAMAQGVADLARAGPQERRAGALRLLQRVAALRPSMAPLANWTLRFVETLADAWDLPPAEWRRRAGEAARLLRAERAGFRDGLRAAARQPLGGAGHVVTLSWSSTVLDLLLAAAPAARVTVAEARPRCEGRVLAERLLERGRRVALITDAQLALAIDAADLVLIGADTICRDGAAVNKAGSRLAALAARAAGKPFLVAADSYKINPRAGADRMPLEAMDPAELWPERPEICTNVYFEPVPAELLSLYITERGAQDLEGIGALVAGWGARYAAAGL